MLIDEITLLVVRHFVCDHDTDQVSNIYLRIQYVCVLSLWSFLLVIRHVVCDHDTDQVSEIILLSRAVQLCVHLQNQEQFQLAN